MSELLGHPVLRDTVVVRVGTETEAVALIDEVKGKQAEGGYTVIKSGYVLKTKRAKGEIIDSWYIVTCQRDYEEE